MNTTVADYLRVNREAFPQERQVEFDAVMKLITRFKPVPPGTKLFEIGTGTGWFQILCKLHGIESAGLDVDADLVRSAIELGAKCETPLTISLGSIETADIGHAKYDVIVANSAFEHVKDWQSGLRRVFAALKPGGVMFFSSTNKFCLRSGEYSFPLYGWLPDRWRYALRVALQGPAIMEWGIDFNQFTYPQLRRFFYGLGFSRVVDLVDMLDPESLNNPTLPKRVLLRTLRRFPVLKHPVLLFAHDTVFVCIK